MKSVVLLYLPWKFDLLGGVDVVADRLRLGLDCGDEFSPILGVHDWVSSRRCIVDSEGRAFMPIALPEWSANAGFLQRLKYGLSVTWQGLRLLLQLHRKRVQVFNAHFPTTNLLAVAILRRLGLWRGRLVLSFHGSDVQQIRADSSIWRLIARQTAAVTTCSESLAGAVRERSLFDPDLVRVVHNGIDISSFRVSAQRDDWTELARLEYLVNVGSFVPHKAQDVIVRAFSKVAKEHPDLHLVLAGGKDNGKWMRGIQELVSVFGLVERIHLVTDVAHERVASLIARARIFVHAGRTEAFGLVLIEAGAVGVPVIAANIGGVPEVSDAGQAAMLYEVGDSDALADKICQMLENPEDAELLARRMSRRVEQYFSVDTMVDGYACCYRAALC